MTRPSHERRERRAERSNFVGAGVFVAGAYWYLYGRPAGGEPAAGGVPAGDAAEPGVGGRAAREQVPAA